MKLVMPSATRDSKLERASVTPTTSAAGGTIATATGPAADPATPRASRLGDFIALYRWDHWVTLTPRNCKITPPALWSEFEHGFIRRLERRGGGRVTWFAACERGAGGVHHVHAVLAGTSALSIDTVAAAWTRGRTKVEVYDPSRSGAQYAAKYADRDEDAWPRWDMSAKFPPMRPDVTDSSAAPRPDVRSHLVRIG